MAQRYLKPIPPHIVEIGGGIAGGMYAREMLKLAANEGRITPQVDIVDRGSEPGGRTATHMFNYKNIRSVPFDLYAHWDHRPDKDGPKNPFTHVAAKLLKKHAAVLGIDPVGLTMRDRLRDVRHIDEQMRMKASLRSPAFDALERAYNKLRMNGPGDDVSLAKLAELTGEEWVQREVRISHSYTWEGTGPENISVRNGFGDNAESGGTIYTDGIEKPVNLLFSKIMEMGANFIANYQVSKIADDDNGCIVFSANDRGPIEADRVAVSVSIGVLQSGTMDLDISGELATYLSGLEMGHMSKIGVLLDAKYLKDLGIRRDTRDYFTIPNGPPDGLRGFIDERPGKHPLLCLQFGGHYALWAENNQHMMPQTADRVLRHTRVFSDYEKHVLGMHFSGTSRDPRFLGAYSHTKVGHDRSGPMQNGRRTFFGEAFALPPQSPGTYGGAAASGRIAARMDFNTLVEEGRLPFEPAAPVYVDMKVRESVAFRL